MKTEFLKIDMNIVKGTIRDRGYYYITAERLFDKNYSGPSLYIVTDNPNFAEENTKLVDMVILTPEQFEPIAEAVNSYSRNEDRARHREWVELDSGEVKSLSVDESIDNLILRQAIEMLEPIQRERFIRHHIYGESYAEIANSQNVSERAIRYSIEIAKKKLDIFTATSLKIRIGFCASIQN